MEARYTAFISYKHAPADIAVASEIQKRLERYHIPAPIRKKTGRDKIGRIFRDKEELPITSDLGDDISRALEEADYLIVICSSSTKLSTWVPREISYFLRNHTKKQVLTVLVDGEPADVIPRELLTDTVERLAPDGTPYKGEIIYEPLSCDFREGIKAARKTEIPRLAAALLGCSYDELVMRERQYKKRRAMAIGIPAACALAVAVGYLIWSRQEISKNYEQALINQSDYLCRESKNYFDDGDRLRAILLALEALPSETAERPLTSKAKEHLAMALHAYRPVSDSNSKADLSEVAEFYVQGDIEKTLSTDDGRYLIVRDSYESAYVWDLVTYQPVLLAGARAPEIIHGTDMSGVRRILEDENVFSVKVISDQSLAFLTDRGLAACALPSGEISWTCTTEAANWSNAKIAVSYDEKEICATVPVEDEAGDGYVSLIAVDSGDGAILERSQAVSGIKSTRETQLVRVSRDRKYAAAVETGREGGPSLLLWKKGSEKLGRLDLGEGFTKVQSMSFSEDGRLVVMGWNDEEDTRSYTSTIVTVTRDRDINVMALDPETLKPYWETSFQSPQISWLEDGTGVFLFDEPGLAICCYANKTAVFDLEDGTLKDEVECTSSLVDVKVNVEDMVIFFLEDGSIGVYDYTLPGSASMDQFFNFSLMWLGAVNDYKTGMISYVIQPDNSQLWLFKDVYDEDFNRFGGDPLPEDFGLKICAATDHAVFVADSNGGVHIYDPEGQKPSQHLTLEGEDKDYYYLGEDVSRDRLWFYYCTEYSDPNELISVSAEDGRIERFRLREGAAMEESLAMLPEFVDATSGNASTVVSTDSVEIFVSGRALPKKTGEGRFAWTDGRALTVGHVEDGALVAEKSVETGLLAGRIFVSPNEKKALILDLGATAEYEKATGNSTSDPDSFTQKNRIVDLETGELTDIDLTLPGFPLDAVWDDNASCAAVTDGEEVEVWSADGKLLNRYLQPGHLVVSAAMHDGELIILYSEGVLTRYDLKDGSLKGQSYVSHYNKYSYVGDSLLVSDGFTNQISWTFADDRLVLKRYDPFSLFRIIGLSDWGEELATDDVCAYDAARDRLISWELDRMTNRLYPGWFEHYTVEALREKAVKDLHGMTLTDEERQSYGLGARPPQAG